MVIYSWDSSLPFWTFFMVWPCLLVKVCECASNGIASEWWFWLILSFVTLFIVIVCMSLSKLDVITKIKGKMGPKVSPENKRPIFTDEDRRRSSVQIRGNLSLLGSTTNDSVDDDGDVTSAGTSGFVAVAPADEPQTLRATREEAHLNALFVTETERAKVGYNVRRMHDPPPYETHVVVGPSEPGDRPNSEKPSLNSRPNSEKPSLASKRASWGDMTDSEVDSTDGSSRTVTNTDTDDNTNTKSVEYRRFNVNGSDVSDDEVSGSDVSEDEVDKPNHVSSNGNNTTAIGYSRRSDVIARQKDCESDQSSGFGEDIVEDRPDLIVGAPIKFPDDVFVEPNTNNSREVNEVGPVEGRPDHNVDVPTKFQDDIIPNVNGTKRESEVGLAGEVYNGTNRKREDHDSIPDTRPDSRFQPVVLDMNSLDTGHNQPAEFTDADKPSSNHELDFHSEFHNGPDQFLSNEIGVDQNSHSNASPPIIDASDRTGDVPVYLTSAPPAATLPDSSRSSSAVGMSDSENDSIDSALVDRDVPQYNTSEHSAMNDSSYQPGEHIRSVQFRERFSDV